MAGHRKWSKVKYLKGPLDQKRGQLFSKLAKEISIASCMGGGDLNGNSRLLPAVLAACAQSMSNRRVRLAIKRGSRETVHAAFDEASDWRLIFPKNRRNLAAQDEGFYPLTREGGVTILAEATAGDVILENNDDSKDVTHVKTHFSSTDEVLFRIAS